jgi:hypothetical protein
MHCDVLWRASQRCLNRYGINVLEMYERHVIIYELKYLQGKVNKIFT